MSDSFNDCALNFIRYKTNVLLVSYLLETYYLKQDVTENIPSYIENNFTVYHLERTYYTIVSIICNYYKTKYNEWLRTDYYLNNGRWISCFTPNIILKLKNNMLSSFNLYEYCSNWDELFDIIERNPIQFKIIIISLKCLFKFCIWIKKQPIYLDIFVSKIIDKLTLFLETLEFKSLESISIYLNDDKINLNLNSIV
jgi:hypothetical protein